MKAKGGIPLNERRRERGEGKLEDIPRKTGKKSDRTLETKKEQGKKKEKEKAIDVESVNMPTDTLKVWCRA